MKNVKASKLERITKKQAKAKIDNLYTEISRLPVTTNSFIFINLYHNVLALYTMDEYYLAFSIANIIMLGLKESVRHSFIP